MSVLKRKRTQSKMEFVTNGYAIEKYSIDFVKRLSVKNARIYQEPIVKLATLQADTAYIANEIYTTNTAEYQMRRVLLGVSAAILHALDKRMADVYEMLMINPQEAFNRQSGKPIPKAEAIGILEKMAETLGAMIDTQDNLIKGVRDSDRKKASALFASGGEDDAAFAQTVKAIAKSFAGLLI